MAWSDTGLKLPQKLASTSVEGNIMPLLREYPNVASKSNKDSDSKLSRYLEAASHYLNKSGKQ